MTDVEWKEMTWYQYGAALDMLTGAIQACPESLWSEPCWIEDADFPGSAKFWYVAYHAIFWTDFYSSETSESFAPPAPFTLSELDPAGALPDRVYSKEELGTYLGYVRQKVRSRIETLPDLMATQQVRLNWIEMSVAELMVYSLRHVMEHEGNLSTLLGQHGINSGGWVSRTKS